MPYCPKCGKEISEDFKYCPECGYHIVVRFSPADLANAFGSVDTSHGRGHVHWLAKERLREIGTKYRLRTEFQYFESGSAHYPRQLTVVLWLSESKIVAAFEIVPKLRNLSAVTNYYDLEKLTATDAEDRFIVNVSRVTGKGYFHRLLENGTIECAPVSEEVYSYKLEDIKKVYPRAYDMWTPEEDNALIKEYKEGVPISELARIHQRKVGGIRARLEKLGLLESESLYEGSKVEETRLVTFLVKSEKNGKICLACVDENRQWIRPIKPGGFDEKDIMMDNGKTIQLFDVVNMRFGAHFPIRHQEENMLFAQGTSIKFVMKLGEGAQKNMLSEIANTRILDTVSSREELYDELTLNLKQSLVLVGPVNLFEIQCNMISGKIHPRIWIVRPNNRQRIFSITCTDIEFCRFIGSKTANLKQSDGIISSQDIAELEGKKTYFVIGLTGDSLDENNEIRDGKYAPPGSSIQPRYWPMVVSVLTVPGYSSED